MESSPEERNIRTIPTLIYNEIKNEKTAESGGLKITDNKDINGGVNGARTRDLQRDRLAF